MEIKKLDLFIILALKEQKGLNVRELSLKLYVDKSQVSKSLINLTKQKIVVSSDDRPKQYYLNIEKWMKNN